MNTRLQVEHPVTEAITGQDLVAWQLRVAAGEPLPLSQEQIRPRGWAIELRINAENPLQQFLPGSGRLRRVDWPAGEGIRIDTGVGAGDFIGTHYDAMLAKLIVHGEDREHCLARLQSAVAATGLFGVDTNLLMLQAITAHPAFHAGLLHTTFLDEHWPQLRRHMLQLQSQPHSAIADQTAVGWQGLSGWRNLSHNTFSRRHHLLGLASPVEQVALSDSAAEQDSQLLAPLPGQVVALHVEQGESVVSGQALLTLEAMKMEHTLTASSDAVVEALHCSTGQRVTHEQLLISFSINTEHT